MLSSSPTMSMISCNGLPRNRTRSHWIELSSLEFGMLTGTWREEQKGLEPTVLAIVAAMVVSPRLSGQAAGLDGQKAVRSLHMVFRSGKSCHGMLAMNVLAKTRISGSTRSGGAPSQVVAAILTDSVESGSLQEHIMGTLRPAYARRYRLVIDAIQKTLVPLGIELPQPGRSVIGGYFIWIQLPKPLLASEFAVRSKEEHNVVVAPGPIFGVYGDEREEELKRAVRLCFSWEKEELLVEGIERLGTLVKGMLDAAREG